MDLAYPIDDAVTIDGKEYEIDLAYDNVLRLIDMLNDDELDDRTQVELGLKMLIDTDLDYEINKKAELFYALFEQAVAGEKEDEQEVDIEGNPMPSIDNNDDGNDADYDFKQDADYIYASFLQCYGIDLFEQQGRMQWDKFKSLLGGLTEDTIFKQIVGIRSAELPTGKGTEKERERLIKQKRRFRLK